MKEKEFAYGNSKRTYSFVSGKNPIDGNMGWRPVDLAGSKKVAFDPVAPIMCVHDMMEHFPGEEYAPHNEYRAQGAMLWLRFEGGFFRDDSEVTNVVEPAFGMLFHHIAKKKLVTRVVPEAKVKHIELPEKTEFALAALVTEAAAFARNRFYSDSRKSDRARILTSLHRGVLWMRLGYHAAAERYKGLNQKRLAKLFKSTVEQVRNPNRVETSTQTLRITMDYAKYTARVQLESLTDVKV